MSAPDAAEKRSWLTPQRIVVGVFILIVVLVLAAVGWWAQGLVGTTKIKATFGSAVNIFPGSSVRILGIQVGRVDSVVAQGQTVEIEMTVNRGVDIPENVSAVQVIPTIIADRYVQLVWPAGQEGVPRASRNITLGMDRTAVPVEIDQIYKSILELSEALGPEGVNREVGPEQQAPLSEAISVLAKNMRGNGQKLGNAIEHLSLAATTLADSSDNISETVRNLNTFVGALKENDAQVRQFNTQMAQFTSFMADERDNLTQALNTLSYALGDVATFIADNREQLGDTVRDLQPTADALYDNREQLLEIMTVLPVTIGNLINAYDAESGTVAMRVNIPELQDPLGAMCNLIDLGALLPGDPAAVQFSTQLAPLVEGCKEIGEQITDGVLEPLLPVLPFGIMSGNKLQQFPAPGTVPGIPNPLLPGSN